MQKTIRIYVPIYIAILGVIVGYLWKSLEVRNTQTACYTDTSATWPGAEITNPDRTLNGFLALNLVG